MQLRGSVPAFDDKRQFSLIYRGKRHDVRTGICYFKFIYSPEPEKKHGGKSGISQIWRIHFVLTVELSGNLHSTRHMVEGHPMEQPTRCTPPHQLKRRGSDSCFPKVTALCPHSGTWLFPPGIFEGCTPSLLSPASRVKVKRFRNSRRKQKRQQNIDPIQTSNRAKQTSALAASDL